ncbi:Flp/Fap pilin component [Arthrobacter sp. FB24]|jgi:pilus assembly protein Flp/PilA|uniref:Flp family type IVb pilin n=1 Tax=Arthrobacter sp. (strain FB24) TaxID=290399 RepID=UPI0000526F40|nr:Flp family type IVb pilin [Arthrobacter sp. FB24]ABK04299.1 Flp/Fap pilin component [Arthrobacter sp. FB24]
MNSALVSMIAFVAGVKNRLTGEEKGATAVEYGLMVALIVIAAILGITAVGTSLQTLFNDISLKL